jgi:tetratricopeptide (TPR) repeat protein/tRNA A-37 threonylcarbamoyl transferase component Bud32
MNFSGLTDSFARVANPPGKCPQCGCASRVRHDLCVGCLLSGALGSEAEENDSLDQLFAEVQVPDTEWRLGNYQILEEIGRGGMGVIYRARQKLSQRIVAVKRVLSYHVDSHETLTRFRREAEAASSLDHPNILPIYEVGTSEGLPFFSMKFAPGGNLLQFAGAIRDQPRRCAALMAKVARAVAYAHEQGIVHRDLKPGNILLDARDEPLVCDFGLAKWLDATSDLTRTLTIFGTPGYIAPEQASSPQQDLNAAADIYSLGAILFDLLAGRPPFLGEHALAVIKQADQSPAPRLRTIAPGLDRDLETICARCLEREPAARYRSAHELAADLERYIDGRAILARPLSPPAQLWRWSRRNPALASSLAACLLLAAAAAAWQIQNWRLETTLGREMVALHSVTALPFVDLDAAAPNPSLTKTINDALRTRLSAIGPSAIDVLNEPFSKWTGTGTSAEVQWAAQRTNSRAVLVGMYRRVGSRLRLSLRLVGKNGSDVLESWTLETNALQNAVAALATRDIGTALYHALETPVRTPNESSLDPLVTNATARAYLNSGRELMARRTIPDMNRAIICFQGAIRAAPHSVAAHSYLALAYVGRNYLLSNPVDIENAYRAADKALQISPNDSNAHRALAFVCGLTGHHDEALEHSFCALEAGDQSERTLAYIAEAWKHLGHPDKAVQWFQKAKASDTLGADVDATLGDAWMLLGDDEHARQHYEVSANFRSDLPEGWLGLCHLKVLNGDFNGARSLFKERAAEYQEFHTTKPFQAEMEFFARNFPEAERLYAEIRRTPAHEVGAGQYGAVSSASALALLKKIGSDLRSADQLIEECIANDKAELAKSPRNSEVLYRLAAEEAIRGNTVGSLTYLQASIAAGWLDYRSLRLDPRFDAVAQTPEFKKIVANLAAHVASLKQQPLSASPL